MTGVEDDILTSTTAMTDPSVRVWRRQRRAGGIAVVVAGLLGATALALALAEALPVDGPVELLAGISSVAAVTGTSMVLFLLLLISRWPVLERAFGQDHLVGWHKRLAPWAVYLIAAHVLLIITASALEANGPATARSPGSPGTTRGCRRWWTREGSQRPRPWSTRIAH